MDEKSNDNRLPASSSKLIAYSREMVMLNYLYEQKKDH